MIYKDLLPAKFKNVNFFVKKEAITSGILNQYSSTPNLTKNRKVINLVNLPTEISLDIFFTGQLASYNARKFLKLGSEISSGVLQIPTFGLFKNMVLKEAPTITTDLKNVGIITCSVSFIENLDVTTQKNFLQVLDDLSQQLNDLLDKWVDLFYFLSNLTERINTIKTNINRVFTAIRSPLLQAKDLANSLKLKEFYENKQIFYKNADTEVVTESLNTKQEELIISSNETEKTQVEPINTLITYNKTIQFLGYLDNLKEKTFNNQNEIVESINNVYKYQENIIYESNLPIEIQSILISYINNLVEFLNSKMQDLPTVYFLNVKNESSLLIAYRLYNDIDKTEEIEKLNNFVDLDDIAGEVKCLRY